MSYRKKEAGFSLMELLVVITILALLAGIVVVSLAGRVDTAKQKTAKVQIANLEEALDLFRLDTGRYPTDDEGLSALFERPSGLDAWNGPYLKKQLPKDPWKNEYVYRHPGEHAEYEIISYGQDGAPGGEKNNQDITSWQDLDSE